MMEYKGTPVVTDMQVIPVVEYDSMLMTLSRAHAPWFTKNLAILRDSSGHTGIGETHGGDYTCEALNSYLPLVMGQPVGRYRSILDTIHKNSTRAVEDDGEGIQTPDISKLKFVVKAEWAIECALLDLPGQYLDLPVRELPGDGKQREQVETLGYLFHVSDKEKAASALPYINGTGSSDAWFRLRRQEMLTPERIVEQAQVLSEKYGFRNFKLKGGVLRGEEEMEAMRALKGVFPEGRINIDPNGAWSPEEAIRICRPMEGVLTYVEDPCGPEVGYSNWEVMAEFKNAVNLPVTTNMIATDWRQFHRAAALRSVDAVLADPYFWGFGGSVHMAQILNGWGLARDSHSSNHLDITLTAFAYVAMAAPGTPTALDTRQIWQDGQNLLKDTSKIVNGYLQIPDKPSMGVTIDMDEVMEVNGRYNRLPSHERDDAMATQYLIPGWKHDCKKSALVG